MVQVMTFVGGVLHGMLLVVFLGWLLLRTGRGGRIKHVRLTQPRLATACDGLMRGLLSGQGAILQVDFARGTTVSEAVCGLRQCADYMEQADEEGKLLAQQIT